MVEAGLNTLREGWGTGTSLSMFVQNIPPEAMPIIARYERNACTPKMVVEIMRSNFDDAQRIARDHRSHAGPAHTGRPARAGRARTLARRAHPVRGVRRVRGSIPPETGTPRVCTQRRFHSSQAKRRSRPPTGCSRPYCSTDIVSSTETDVRVGDHRWRELLDQHDKVAMRLITRHRGRLVKTTGDGLLATFDGPARAITCAQEIALGAKPLGLDIRASGSTPERWSCAAMTSPASA